MFNRPEMNMPMVELELKIESTIKMMVQKLLLTDKEAEEVVLEAVNNAVAHFNWRQQIHDQVQGSLKTEVNEVLRNIARRLQWDEKLFGDIKEAVQRALIPKTKEIMQLWHVALSDGSLSLVVAPGDWDSGEVRRRFKAVFAGEGVQQIVPDTGTMIAVGTTYVLGKEQSKE